MNAVYILSGLGIASLLSEIFNFKKYLLFIVAAGLLATLAFTIADWDTQVHYFNEMVVFDNYALAFSALLTTTTLVWLLLSKKFFDNAYHISDFVALIVFALVGAVLMSSFNNMAVLFIGIEILSLALYVMAGSKKNDLLSNEASLKYFLLGSFATGFLLFGIALVYGATGSFNLNEIATYSASNNIPMFYYTGIIMIMIALAFKVSAVPFHFWAPDVYQGSPVQITSFMATIVKTAAFAAFFRLFYTSFALNIDIWIIGLGSIAMLTLVIANITAVLQHNAKRLLAYSSVAHAGYLLMALLVMDSYTAGAVLFYAASYSAATLISFYVLEKVIENTGTSEITGFAGLYKKSPFLAFVLVVAFLSLAGIPPLAGFFAKYYVFTAALGKGLLWLVIAGIAGSLMSVFYYFKILAATFAKTDEETTTIHLPILQKIVICLLVIVLIGLGIFPDYVFELI